MGWDECLELNLNFKSDVERQGGSHFGWHQSTVVTHIMDIYAMDYKKQRNIGLLLWFGERTGGGPRNKITVFGFVQDKDTHLGIPNYLILWRFSRMLLFLFQITQYFQNIPIDLSLLIPIKQVVFILIQKHKNGIKCFPFSYWK